MPVNVSHQYTSAEKKYLAATSLEEKIRTLKEMISQAPSHKGAEKLRAELNSRLAKFKSQLEKQRTTKKSGHSLAIKKQGAAQICLVGTIKSNLLTKLTNAKSKNSYKPNIGTLDYHGIKLQIIEIPPIKENFQETTLGPTFLGILNQADLMIFLFNNEKEYKLLQKELKQVKTPFIIYNKQENLSDLIWKKLNLIKVYTKQPGKDPTHPPIALEKNSQVKDLASHVHKDFLKKFKFARVWGKSVKFDGAQVGLNHKLKDNDIVELHLK